MNSRYYLPHKPGISRSVLAEADLCIQDVLDSTEECCDEALSYLCELLEQPEFPRSYSIKFRGPEKIYLSTLGLPKKEVPPPDRQRGEPGYSAGD